MAQVKISEYRDDICVFKVERTLKTGCLWPRLLENGLESRTPWVHPGCDIGI